MDVYTIRRSQLLAINPNWYFVNIIEELDIEQIVWMPLYVRAKKFSSPEQVENFAYDHIKHKYEIFRSTVPL